MPRPQERVKLALNWQGLRVWWHRLWSVEGLSTLMLMAYLLWQKEQLEPIDKFSKNSFIKSLELL
ncbi:hypothetical protein PN36_19290 [Candidatus Thiomargarita nelsonii]|uniref:Uncharacterized protein n=1 Tax=Candidatus Thiomargarita nelsonii TaxID=1003181 RepID=A0A0A6RSF8_9GAMM|nr:hypothetical protein PN36_19290 [Candidatus Thiomargarita nelsonii]